jgi:hypothetical protein
MTIWWEELLQFCKHIFACRYSLQWFFTILKTMARMRKKLSWIGNVDWFVKLNCRFASLFKLILTAPHALHHWFPMFAQGLRRLVETWIWAYRRVHFRHFSCDTWQLSLKLRRLSMMRRMLCLVPTLVLLSVVLSTGTGFSVSSKKSKDFFLNYSRFLAIYLFSFADFIVICEYFWGNQTLCALFAVGSRINSSVFKICFHW